MNQPHCPPGFRLAGRSSRELRWRVTDPRITIGRGTYGAPEFILYSAEDRVRIGNYCSIAKASKILAGGEHNYRSTTSFPFHWYDGEDPDAVGDDPTKIRYRDAVYKGPVTIGSDVWIGYGALILSGVTIGHGAVIGAGTVVGSDVPPYSIAIGNPWKLLKPRFAHDVIEGLLKIRWWDWNPPRIREFRHLLLGDPRCFLDAVGRIPSDELKTFYEVDPIYDIAESEKEPIRYLARFKSITRQLIPPVFLSSLRGLRRVVTNVVQSKTS